MRAAWCGAVQRGVSRLVRGDSLAGAWQDTPAAAEHEVGIGGVLANAKQLGRVAPLQVAARTWQQGCGGACKDHSRRHRHLPAFKVRVCPWNGL